MRIDIDLDRELRARLAAMNDEDVRFAFCRFLAGDQQAAKRVLDFVDRLNAWDRSGTFDDAGRKVYSGRPGSPAATHSS